MERIKDTRQATARRRVAQTPVTEKTLASFEKSAGPAQHVMVKRIINALRNAWTRQAEIEDELRREQQKRAEELGNDKRPAALLVVHTDGWVEAYADKSLDIASVELTPFDDPLNVSEKLRPGQRDKYGRLLNGSASLNCYPYYLSRPNTVSQEALRRLSEWDKRMEFAERWNELLGLLSKRVRNEKTI